ncbi:MAG TPA: cytochrome P450 [Acidimicrobiales bacterium]
MTKTLPDVPGDLVYDPYDYEIDENPHPTWKRLRDEAPLYYNERHGFYALSRYQDVLDGLVNWETYSSARGTVLELIQPGPMTEEERAGVSGVGSMIFSDPPNHDVARKIVNRSFTPRAISRLEGRLRDLCHRFLDDVEGRDEFDFLGDFAARMPPMIIGEMLGVPEEDQEQLGHWVDMFMHYDPEAETGDTIQGVMQFNPVRLEGSTKMRTYMGDLIAERQKNPRDDMISTLLEVDVPLPDGSSRKLDVGEVSGFFMLLQSAGSETTARMLGWAAILLARHPDQRDILVKDLSVVPNAVEELLRYEAPSPVQARLVTRDVEWHGASVPAGSKMTLLNGSAGRDEREYPNPDVFDVQRQMDRHMTFGYSTHFCLGAALARLEGRVIIEEMLDRHPEWDVDESRVEMVHTTTVRGPAKVPVKV